MAKSYQGSLTLEWYNKEKAIILQSPEAKKDSDIPAPRLNWVNKEESLFYEISDSEGRGLEPFWVDRNDIRVKEIRPLVFQKGYRAVATDKPGMLPGTEQTYKIETVEAGHDQPLQEIPNMLIRGDNLLALNALVKMFEGKPDAEKVKCIYIDPPYNTGSAFEHYDDNLEHSEWLTLTRDRISRLREFLALDGSMWIAVDDREAHYLKIICDEIFGRQSFVASFIWKKVDSPNDNKVAITPDHEFILCYAKAPELVKFHQKIDPAILAAYRSPDEFSSRPYRDRLLKKNGKNSLRIDRPSMFFPIKAPDDSDIYPIHDDGREACWALGKDSVHKLIESGDIIWKKRSTSDGFQYVPYTREYAPEIPVRPYQTIWSDLDTTRQTKSHQKDIYGEEGVFETPKPENVIERIFSISTNPGDLVLDCFAGSGTTLAVAQKMGRRYIGVEIGKHADTHIIPRLQKVLSGEDQGGISKAQNWHGGGAFQYYHVGPSIIDSAKGDFNWKLGVTALQEALLQTYDFAEMQSLDGATLGILRSKADVMAGICSLAAPGKGDEIMHYPDFVRLVQEARKLKPRSIVFFTNRGIEVAEDEKPEDVEIIKVPQAIFAELEK
ncbi:MAG: site-specific DNA-methyltransferase [Spirochaetota bacterium]